jgi:transposase-like protein
MSTNRTRRQRWTPEKASAVLAELAASGLSVQKFAARAGLDPERLYRWRRQLGATAPAPAAAAFVEVRPSLRSRVEIVLRSGHVLFVPETIDAGALHQLVEMLERTGEC